MKTKLHSRWPLMYMAIIFLTAVNGLYGQDKISPKLRLTYIKHMDGHFEIKAKAFAKQGKEINPCAGATIGLYSDADYGKLVQKMTTDEAGLLTFTLTANEAASFKPAEGHYHFYARLQEDARYESQEADVEAMDAAITAAFEQVSDSERIVQASIHIFDDDSAALIAGVKLPLKVYVKRALCLLPVGEDLNYTDEEGNVEVAFPNDIPGDKDGNLTVIVKLDDDESYGTVQFEKAVKWGVPLVAESPIEARSIIGARNNAPWFMVLVINAMLVGVWGYLLYIAYSLFRIKRLGKS